MILFFHFLCLLTRYIVLNISKSISVPKIFSGNKNEAVLVESHSSDYLEGKRGPLKKPVYEGDTLMFFPPVYVQRYESVGIILEDFAWNGEIRKVADFGCAELGFFMYLKNMKGVNEILEIDIDSEMLERYSYKAAPLTSDYIISKGSNPSDVYILAGSVADYDDHLIGTDTVIGIELIEHLTEEALAKMPYNVFHNIRPKLAVFTTPNADFNSLFPNFSGTRHADHKFEWTRQQFFKWAQKIIKQYPEYSVRFYGIGAGPEGTENLGCCSQMVVFRRSEEAETYSSAREETGEIHNYKLIKHYKYPVYVDARTKTEKIVHEIQYQLSNISRLSTYYNYEDNESEIPLSFLKEFVADLCPNDQEFRNILADNGLKLKLKDNSWFLVHKESDSASEDNFREEDWLNEEIPINTGDEGEYILDENWDWNDNCTNLEDSINMEFPKSVEAQAPFDPKCRISVNDRVDKTYICAARDRIKSAQEISTRLSKDVDPAKSLHSCDKIKNEELKKLNPVKRKIPQRRIEKERGENSYLSSRKKSSVSYVCKLNRKISKSCSLDSCLENINCKPYKSESGSDLIPSGSLSFRYVPPPPSDRGKFVVNDSGSSLLSNSLEKAPDSGYPLSFSPPDVDLTPEQVDELFTESEIESGSSSVSSEDEVLEHDLVNRAFRQDFFVADEEVENGDLANNNRDREEGFGERLVNEIVHERDPNFNMLFVPEVDEFPPWLLNLGYLAGHPFYIPQAENNQDERDGDDSSSDLNQSLDGEDIDYYLELS